jgi:hypothetical protein
VTPGNGRTFPQIPRNWLTTSATPAEPWAAAAQLPADGQETALIVTPGKTTGADQPAGVWVTANPVSGVAESAGW